MILEFFNFINELTPVLSTTTKASLTLSDNKVDNFINVLLITKLILIIISTFYLSYLYFYLKQEIKNDYIPYILIQISIVNILLIITFAYASYQYFNKKR